MRNRFLRRGQTCFACLGAAMIIQLLGAVVRPANAEISWEGGVTTTYQYADDDRVDPEFTASADLFATIPRSRGEWFFYIEGSTSPDRNGVSSLYPTANADAGSVLNRDGDGGLQISEANYTFFLDKQSTLMFGLIDPSAWLDRSRITNDENTHFLNGSFVNNATIEFPDYTLGGVLRWEQSANRPEMTFVIASSDGIADLPDRSYQDLLNLTANERAAFVGFGAGWLREATTFRLGAWLRTGDHAVFGAPGESDQNYGAYGVFGWQSGSNAINFRMGFANQDVSVATFFSALAYQRESRFGLFGLGLARTGLSNSFRQADLVNVTAAEMFFRVPLGGDHGHITPSIQLVENPGFDTSGSTNPSSAIVFGLRFHWSY